MQQVSVLLSEHLRYLTWLEAYLECGCRVTSVPGSVELYHEEVSDLPGFPS